jgi:hypothetical protein
MPTTATRANHTFHGGTREGVPISTQSGPYYNSSPNKQVRSNTAWVNTYFPEETKKK